MNLTTRVSILFYAIALIAFGVVQIIFGNLVAGRPPSWPESLPGHTVAVYATGLLLIATGITVTINWMAKWGLFFVAAFILLWAGLLNIYQTVINLDYGFPLTGAGKALTLGSGALLVAGFAIAQKNDLNSEFDFWVVKLAGFCRYFTGFFLLASGVQHFLFADFVKFLIPTWIPEALFWTYFAGVALFATGFALLSGIKLKLAAMAAACMIFVWVFILHIPRAVASPTLSEWAGVFEALAVCGILLLLSQKSKSVTYTKT
jgi:uncharacterized membrane protein YphA (DoxX/SURF4 family)